MGWASDRDEDLGGPAPVGQPSDCLLQHREISYEYRVPNTRPVYPTVPWSSHTWESLSGFLDGDRDQPAVIIRLIVSVPFSYLQHPWWGVIKQSRSSLKWNPLGFQVTKYVNRIFGNSSLFHFKNRTADFTHSTKNALRSSLHQHSDWWPETRPKSFTFCIRTVPPRFLSFISVFSQVQHRERCYKCEKYSKTEALVSASFKAQKTWAKGIFLSVEVTALISFLLCSRNYLPRSWFKTVRIRAKILGFGYSLLHEK